MISVIIPAYEEAGSVVRVVDFAKSLSFVDEVIVIDDGSMDETARKAAEAGARVVIHKRNLGKTRAVQTGAKHAKQEDVLMLDADMQGLSKQDFSKAYRIYQEADMVVLDYGGQHWVVRHSLLPATSGARFLARRVLLEAPFTNANHWEVEGVINRYLFRRKATVRVVVAKDLFSPRKESKYGRLRGMWLNLRSLILISLSLGWLKLPLTWLDWWRFQRLRKE